MATKLDRIVTYLDRLLHIKSHKNTNPLIKLSCKVTLSILAVVLLLPKLVKVVTYTSTH